MSPVVNPSNLSVNREIAKVLAKRAGEILKELGYEVKHTHCLELLSRLANFRSWNVAQALNANLELATKLASQSASERFKKVGEWIYYHDGGAGEVYAKTDLGTLAAFMDKHDGSPAPFEIAIPGNGDEVSFYHPNKDYPYLTLTVADYNREHGTQFTSVREVLGGQEEDHESNRKLAIGLLEKLEQYGRDGLPAAYQDSMDQYLPDMWPDLPWNEAGLREAVQIIFADPRFPAIRQAFQERYKFDLQPEFETALQ